MSDTDLNIWQRFRAAIKANKVIDNSPERHDSSAFQTDVSNLLREFSVIQMISHQISLFSPNESLNEVNTNYIPFATIEYYRASLFQKSLANNKGEYIEEEESKHQCKMSNLGRAKALYMVYLHLIDSFGGVLSKEQHSKLESINSYNPTNEELLNERHDPATRRAMKIASFKAEKELTKNLLLLEDYFLRLELGSIEEDANYDEDVLRQMFIDQMKLFALRSFAGLELVARETQVLQQRIPFLEKVRVREIEDKRIKNEVKSTGYTHKLEKDPQKLVQMTDLFDKQGKILQPFVLTNNRQNLKRNVFGTGQVLPSMSIENYLEYELANGKMANTGDINLDTEENDDSDEDLRKREWDDWKDDNPRGSGNMKANLG